MEDFELIGPNGTDVNNEFLKAYRDSLKNQYDASISSLRQQRRNNDAAIMSAANERGMMYSNFPQRSKIQSETEYLNNLAKLNSTYQTGLNSLRNNAVNAYNQIKAYEEAISDLQSSTSGGGGSGSGGNSGTNGTNSNNTNSSDLTSNPYNEVKFNSNTETNSGKHVAWENIPKAFNGEVIGDYDFLEPAKNATSNFFDWITGQSNTYHSGSDTYYRDGKAYKYGNFN